MSAATINRDFEGWSSVTESWSQVVPAGTAAAALPRLVWRYDPVPTPSAPTYHKELHTARVTATIASKVGLYAHPAATFVEAVAEEGIPVTVAEGGGAAVNASFTLGVIALNADFGDVVTLVFDADGTEAALGSLKALLETGLDT